MVNKKIGGSSVIRKSWFPIQSNIILASHNASSSSEEGSDSENINESRAD